jgi:hypothetical protein
MATLLIVAASLGFTVTSGAQGQAPRPRQVPDTGAEDAAAPAAPDPAAERTLQAITSRSVAGLVTQRRPDGGFSIDLQGRFQHLMLATPGPDGRLEIACHTGESTPTTAVTAIHAWHPTKGGSQRPLDASALRALLPPLPIAPKTPEVR